jgi:pyrimidine-nucleoside phosphorylase
LRIQEILLKKRDGKELEAGEIKQWVDGYLSGEIKDYHVAAWLMAVYFRGMTPNEIAALTDSMLNSGNRFPRDKDNKEIWIDKHSTGGVGDKTSLILVPWVTSAWSSLGGKFGTLKIPMVSGRGLAFTGGTLDKLESVQGFNTGISLDLAMQLLEREGFVMMGQTAEMAPADRLLYSLRDVTGTVESIPLIVSSILSKKLAENIDALVLDVKFGQGAMMKTLESAEKLARTLIDVAALHSVRATAIITSMEEPLGRAVGHLLEMRECLQFLRGEDREAGLMTVTRSLGAQMIFAASRGGVSLEEAERLLDSELKTERPVETFKTMLKNQDGDWETFLAECGRLETNVSVCDVVALEDGYVARVDSLAVAGVVGLLGGSRARKEDVIDFGVGVLHDKKVGEAVKKGDRLARLFYRNPEVKDEAFARLQSAITTSPNEANPTRWIEKVMT